MKYKIVVIRKDGKKSIISGYTTESDAKRDANQIRRFDNVSATVEPM